MVHGACLSFLYTNMNTLQQILEGLLSSDYDISDEEVHPTKLFVDKYKSSSKKEGHYYIESKWSIEEIDKLVLHYGKYEGIVQSIDVGKLLRTAYSKKNPLVIVAPFKYRVDFFIVVPTAEQCWDFYTDDPGYYESSLFSAIKYGQEELKWSYLFTEPDQPIRVYRLKNNQFLKDLQKYLK